MIGLSRAYDPPGAGDGWRVLVDRVWPRGVRKAKLRLDQWERDAAPTTALRRWYGHDPAKWDEFRRRYFRELDGRPDVVAALRVRAAAGPLTLVYGARDRAHSQATALREYLVRPEPRARMPRRPASCTSSIPGGWPAPEFPRN